MIFCPSRCEHKWKHSIFMFEDTYTFTHTFHSFIWQKATKKLEANKRTYVSQLYSWLNQFSDNFPDFQTELQ